MNVVASILTDLDASQRLANAYWKALAGGVTGADERARCLIWPLMTYAAAFPAWQAVSTTTPLNELTAHERTSFTGQVMTDLRWIPEWIGIRAPDSCHYVLPSRDFLNQITAAAELVAHCWPAGYREFEALVRGVAPVDSRRIFSSTSDPKIFGLIHLDARFYAERSVAELATALVHETAHHALFVATAVDPTIVDPKRVIYSPFRGEDRPAIGVLHAAMALARMLLWGKALARHGGDAPDRIKEQKRITTELRPKFEKTMAELAKLPFTTKGAELREDLLNVAGELHS